MEVRLAGQLWEQPADESDSVARDRRRFTCIYREFYEPIGRYLYRRTGSRQATEDLLQDVFLRAWRAYANARDRGVPIRFWLYRIATNCVSSWARGVGRKDSLLHAEPTVLDPDDTAEEVAAAQEEAETARAALLELDSRFQAVLTLHYLEGLTVEEVAAVLRCRIGTVKSRLARGREKLRVRLERMNRTRR